MRSRVAVLALVLIALACVSGLLLVEMTRRLTTTPVVQERSVVGRDPAAGSEIEPRRGRATARRPGPGLRSRARPTPKRKPRRDAAHKAADGPRPVTVQLVSAIDGAPIGMTPVRIGHHGRGRTDGEGRLTFDAAGSPSMRLRPDGYPPFVILLPSSSEPGGNAIPVVRIDRAGVLQGTVVGARGELPEGCRVEATDLSAGLRDGPGLRYLGARVATVDRSGAFRFDGLPARTTFRVRVTARNAPTTWLPRALTLEPGSVTTLHVRMPDCGVVRGRVLDQHGQGLPGARISHHSDGDDGIRTSRSNAYGDFVLRGVPLGAGTIKARPALRNRYTQLGFPPAEVRMKLKKHGEVARTVLRVHRGRFVEGRVVAGDGEGVHFARVEASGLSRRTDRNGDFRIGPFPPGSVPIRAIGPERAGMSPRREIDSNARGVVLRLVKPARIAGHVVNESGPGQGKIYVFRRGRRDWSTARSNDDRAFVIEGLEPAVYDLYLVTDDGRFGSREGIRVAEGESIDDLQLAVKGTCALTVTLEGPGGTPHWFDLIDCTILRDGRVLLFKYLSSRRMTVSVPPGPVEVRLTLERGLKPVACLKRSTVLRLGETYRIDWYIPELPSGKKRTDP